MAAVNQDPEVLLAKAALQLFQQQLAQNKPAKPTSVPIGKVDLSSATDEQRARAESTVAPMVIQLEACSNAVKNAVDKPGKQEARVALRELRAKYVREMQDARKRTRQEYDNAVGNQETQTFHRDALVDIRLALQLFLQKTGRPAATNSGPKVTPIGKIDLTTASEEQRARAEAVVLPLVGPLRKIQEDVAAADEKATRQAARQALKKGLQEVAVTLQATRKNARAAFDAETIDEAEKQTRREALIEARLSLQLFQTMKSELCSQATKAPESAGPAVVPEIQAVSTGVPPLKFTNIAASSGMNDISSEQAIPPAVQLVEPPTPSNEPIRWLGELAMLKSMGFDNTDLLLPLLEDTKGNIDAVVATLLD